MKITNRVKLKEKIMKHGELRSSVETWVTVVEAASWKRAEDVREIYPRAEEVKRNHWRFDLNRGGFKLNSLINYDVGAVAVLGICDDEEKRRNSGAVMSNQEVK